MISLQFYACLELSSSHVDNHENMENPYNKKFIYRKSMYWLVFTLLCKRMHMV
jgi:hypothetical protein